jgi:hypothetical protein
MEVFMRNKTGTLRWIRDPSARQGLDHEPIEDMDDPRVEIVWILGKVTGVAVIVALVLLVAKLI